MKHILLTLLFSFTVPHSIASEWTPIPIRGVSMDCFEEKLPVAWSFCINKTLNSSSKNLIYHFHGRNGDATWWNDQTYYTGKVHATWLVKNEPPPIVASISFGKLWLLVDNSHGTENLYRFFLDHAMKRIEQEIGRPIEQRMAVGESMGGVNALILAMKSKGVFSKVATLCPVLPPVSPFAPISELYDYIKRSSMSLKRALMTYWFSMKFYPSKDVWEANDPLHLSKSFTATGAPSLYLGCGEKDEWGCLEGSLQLVANVKAAGGQIEWHQRPGGHCDIDEGSLATFLSTSD
jgi:hypothetical protein